MSGIHSPDQTESALRDFWHAVGDVRTEDRGQWRHSLAVLMHHCRTNAVMQSILAPLWEMPTDGAAWLAASQLDRSTRTRTLTDVPLDTKERASLFLKVFAHLVDTKAQFPQIAGQLFGFEGTFSDRLRRFDESLLSPFARVVGNMLDDAYRSALAGNPLAGMHGTNVHTHVHIAGDMKQSVIATGNANVTQISGYQAATDLGRAFQELRGLLVDVAEEQRVVVGTAIDALAQAADTGAGSPVELARAAEVIARASPSLRHRLGDFVLQASANVTAAALVQSAPALFHAINLALAAL